MSNELIAKLMDLSAKKQEEDALVGGVGGEPRRDKDPVAVVCERLIVAKPKPGAEETATDADTGTRGAGLRGAEPASQDEPNGGDGDPMAQILVALCAVEMLAKDLHYRANGKPFYGLHELADQIWKVGHYSDELNEVYYMGEKGTTPPERAVIAAKAANPNYASLDEDGLISALFSMLGSLAASVEAVKKAGVSSGASAVLDEISKTALQMKGLLARTAAVAKVAGQIAIRKPTGDVGTSEGAKKGWLKKKRGGGSMAEAVSAMKKDEKATGVRGIGEILDEGRLGKDRLRAMIKPINEETIAEKMKKIKEMNEIFSINEPVTREDVVASIEKFNREIETAMKNAPEKTEHKYVYYA